MICYENVPYLWEKYSIHLSRYEKSIAYKIDFSKFSNIMRHYAFFFGIMRIIHSELNYAISHRRIIPEALHNIFFLFS